VSRSYKKNPYSKDGGRSSKSAKRISSRMFRRDTKVKVSKGDYDSLWKKQTQALCSWDVNDHVSYYPREDAISDFYSSSHRFSICSLYADIEEALDNWEKWYRRK
jgi:hypothetical protein